jgi:thiamine kinase-like enzyme
MSGRPVAELLRKIHTSKALLDMLKRLGKEPLDLSRNDVSVFHPFRPNQLRNNAFGG